MFARKLSEQRCPCVTAGIVPEGEWDAFLAALRKQLPVTFRITGIGKFANDFRDKLQANLFSHFSNGDILVRVDRRC